MLARRIFCFVTFVVFSVSCGSAVAVRGPYDWAFIRLDYKVKEKTEQLTDLTNRLSALARKAAEDPSVLSFFDINWRYSVAALTSEAPPAVVESIDTLRDEFDRHYVENYFAFHDMLFISLDGTVFYSMLKESDVYRNLMTPEEPSPLALCLKQQPQNEVFVDFHYYAPSAEPAAFFVEPIYKDKKQVGWLALQCAINKVNSIFVSSDDLGQTGETFLVNKDGYMLTESHFEDTSTILKKHLDDRNIQAKFTEQSGHRIVTDYRNATALTSFSVFPFMDTRWLIVAKMDKDEIVTNHYVAHHLFFKEQLTNELHKAPLPPSRPPVPASEQAATRVDMDEFLKAAPNEPIETTGISTCTGVLMAYPKRFAYLAHVSPKDKLYGGNDTDLLGQMTSHMQSFHIYPYEKRNVVFVLVAPHLDSFPAIVDAIVEHGFHLSQIYVMHNPQAAIAAMAYDYKDNCLGVRWYSQQAKEVLAYYCLDDAVRVSDIIERAMAPEL